MVLWVSDPMHQVLFSSPADALVNDFIDIILLHTIFSDDGSWSFEFMVRKKLRVVRDEGFQKTCMEPWEGLQVVW